MSVPPWIPCSSCCERNSRRERSLKVILQETAPVLGMFGALGQVIMNLVVNAMQALPTR